MVRSLVYLAATLAAGWLIAVAMLASLQRGILYHARGVDRSLAERYKVNEVAVPTDGAVLRGWFLRHRNPDAPVVIYFGGNADEVSRYLDRFASLTCCSALLVNYRGYGESGGEPSEAALRADGVALYDAAQRIRGAPGPTVLFGRSLGTGVAISTAVERAASALVLVSPYDSIAAVGRDAYPYVPVRLLLKDKFDCLDLAARIVVPVLAYVAGNDTVIRPVRSTNLIAALAGKVDAFTVPGADHNTLFGPHDTWRTMERWIVENTLR